MKITSIHCNHCGKILQYPYIDAHIDVEITAPGMDPTKGDLCDECASYYTKIAKAFMSAYHDSLSEEGLEVLFDESDEAYSPEDDDEIIVQ